MDIDEQKKAVGERIKLIRKKRGQTLEEFGNEIGGVLKSNVSKWERGQSLPNNTRIKKIAELGNVTVNYLLTGKSETELISDSINKLFQSIDSDAKEQLEILNKTDLSSEQSLFFSKAIELFYKYYKNEEITTKFATFFHSLAYFSDPEVISELSDRNLENDTIDELKELIELIKNQSDNNNL